MPDAVQQTYGTTKYGQPESTTAASGQSPASQHAVNQAAHLPQQSFQPYPYYPYYMNQYQQAPYQQPLYQQQHFGGGKGGVYGAAGFQGSSANASSNGKVAQSAGAQGMTQNNAAYGGYGAQQFYPNSYEEHDYSKSNGYGQQNFSFGSQQVKTEYKAQVFFQI